MTDRTITLAVPEHLHKQLEVQITEAAALQLNRAMAVCARRRWVLAGWHPPQE